MQITLRPFGFVKWIAPRRPLLGFALIAGVLLAYAHNQVQDLAIATTFGVVETIFLVDVDAGSVDVSIPKGRVILSPLVARLGDKEVLRSTVRAHFSLDWNSLTPRIDRIVLDRPHLRLAREEDGHWNLEQVVASESLSGSDDAGIGPALPPIDVNRGKVTLTSPLLVEALLLEEIEVSLFSYANGMINVRDGRCRIRPQGISQYEAKNELRFRGRLVEGKQWRGELEAELARGDVQLLRALLGPEAVSGAEGEFSASLESRGELSTYEVDAKAALDFPSATFRTHDRTRVKVRPLKLRIHKQPNRPPHITGTAERVDLRTVEGCTVEGNRLEAEVRLLDHAVELSSFDMQAEGGRIRGAGRVHLVPGREYDLRFTGTQVDAGPLGCATLPDTVRMAGPMDLEEAHWKETESDRSVRVSLVSTSLRLGLEHEERQASVHLETVRARLHVTTSTVRLFDLRGSGAGTSIEGDGYLRTTQGEVDFSLAIEDFPLSIPATVLTTVFRDAFGDLDARLQLEGDPDDLRIRGRLEVPEAQLEAARSEAPLRLEQLSLPLSARVGATTFLEIPDFSSRLWGAPTTGTFRLEPEDFHAELRSRELPIEELLRFLGRREVGARGRVDTQLDFRRRGTTMTLEGTATARELPFRPGGETLGLRETKMRDVTARFSARDDGKLSRILVPEANARALGGDILLKNGEIKLGPDPSVELEISGSDLDAVELSRVLSSPTVDFAGRAEFSGQLEGPLDSPRLTARAVIEKPLLVVMLGEKPVRAFPDRLDGQVSLTPGKVHVGPLSGTLGGGPFDLEVDVDLADEAHPWRCKINASKVDVRRFVEPYLEGIQHDVYGTLDASALLHGKGTDAESVNAGGRFQLSGGIRSLGPLKQVEKDYKLRNLHDIEVKSASATLGAARGKLAFRNLELKTSHGSSTGEVMIGLDGTLGGENRVALDRMILSSGHRLLTQMEGGRYFNFRLRLAGTLMDPDYDFRVRGGAGNFLKGAVFFAPVAVFSGLKRLFGGGRRRPRKLPQEEPKALPSEEERKRAAPSPPSGN